MLHEKGVSMHVILNREEKSETIRLKGSCGVEELDRFFQMVKENPDARLDLQECTCFHTGFLQIILAADIAISRPPTDPFLRMLLPDAGGR